MNSCYTKRNDKVIKIFANQQTDHSFQTYASPPGEGSAPVIARGCAQTDDPANLCQNEEFYRDLLGYEINCCTTSLCNVGRNIPDPEATIKPAPMIDCYTCQANLTADGLPADQSSCGRTDFDGSGQDAALWPCDTGVCLVSFNVALLMSVFLETVLCGQNRFSSPKMFTFTEIGYTWYSSITYVAVSNNVLIAISLLSSVSFSDVIHTS